MVRRFRIPQWGRECVSCVIRGFARYYSLVIESGIAQFILENAFEVSDDIVQSDVAFVVAVFHLRFVQRQHDLAVSNPTPGMNNIRSFETICALHGLLEFLALVYALECQALGMAYHRYVIRGRGVLIGNTHVRRIEIKCVT